MGQKVYLGQAYNQRGLVGAYWKCPAIADYIPASLYSLDRQSLGSAGELLSILHSPLPVSVLETEPVAAPSLQGLYGVSVFFQVILEGQRSWILWSPLCLGNNFFSLLFISIILFAVIIMHLI